MSDDDSPRVVVVGGGVAGLTAARLLRKEGMAIVLVEREQRFGGRLLTHAPTPDGPRFDLGPQYLCGAAWGRGPDRPVGTPAGLVQVFRDAKRQDLLQTSPVGYVGRGSDDLPVPPFVPEPEPVTSVRGGMAALAELLRPSPPHQPDGIEFRNQTDVRGVERRDRQWRVHTTSTLDGSEDLITADAVLLTPPAPQALELIRGCEADVPYELRNELRRVRYACCFALTAAFTGPSLLGPRGGVRIEDSPVEWVTDNHLRGVSPVGPALTGLSAPLWAEAHWDEPDADVARQLLPCLATWAEGEPTGVHLWRWRLAQPVEPLAVPCLVGCQEPPLVFAGDGFAAPAASRLDAAHASGLAGARRVVQLIRKVGRFALRRRTRRIVLEVGVTGVEEALRAQMLGADRLELCSGLEVGGLTPSPGTFLAVREAIRLPVYVLLRPRTGGFAYSDSQFETMRRDAEWFLRNGANGIVFGVLGGSAANEIDRRRCRQLVELAGGRAVFHRAFDFLREPLVRLEELADLGFQRVQTSGGSATAEGGSGRLAAWIAHAGWQIEIMPAGGITPAVVAQLLRETQADQVHASLRAPVPDLSLLTNPRLGRAMGVADPQVGWATTDGDAVQAMRNELDRFVQAGDESDG
jgi:copper homeostasis protein